MKRLRLTCLLLCCSVLFSGCGRIPKNVTIDGMNVSGLSEKEALETVSERNRLRLSETAFTLVTERQSLVLRPEALGLIADSSGAVERALSLKRRDENRAVATVWTVDENLLAAAVSSAARELYVPPVDAEALLDAGAAEPFSFSPGRDGQTVDENALSALLREAAACGASRRISVPLLAAPPAVTLEQVQKNRQLVASFTTSFQKSPYNNANRVFNIKKAAGKINGVILEAGETFDCNEVLGDRNEANGWRLAPGIVNGAYESEYGGGVCQVSSTLFNAVLMADLSIDERHPHSWPMGYVDIGRDATISTGGKNFRFTNSTEHELYLFARIDETEKTLTVSLYGAPLPGGGWIELASEQTGWLAAPKETVLLDESLPQNTKLVAREARRGRTARTYRLSYSAEGELLEKELSHEDVYRSIDGVTYLSTDLYEA